MMTQQKENETSAEQPVPSPVIEDGVFKEGHLVPEYLRSVYDGRYFHPLFTKLFDDNWTAAVGSFFWNGKLIKTVVNEIIEGNDVLQLGVAAGNLEREIVQKMNSKGQYHIEDISLQHIDAMKPRVSAWLNVALKERDFTIPNDLRYDVIVGYFILHELPDSRKKAALKRAFNALKPNGKMIFIDYATPKKFHPLKFPVKMFNRLYEPFAESLWHNEIQDFALKTDKLIWDKKTFFGGMYQCVIAQRRD